MIAPRCIARCKDGTQCGRRVPNPANPLLPTCHLHDGRDPVSPIIPPSDEIDALKELKRLARDRDSRVRLRAIDLLLDMQKKADDRCERCANQRARSRAIDDDMSRMTDEQKDDLRVLCARVHQLRAVARTQPIRPSEEF